MDISQTKKRVNRNSKSMDYGPFNSPMSLLSDYYKNENERKMKYKTYASQLRNDMVQKRSNRED